MNELRTLLPIVLVWNAISAALVLLATMRSAQITRRQESLCGLPRE